MSDITANHPKGLGYVHMTSKWGWFVALGIVLILVGLFALIDTVAFTIVSVIFIGAMLAVGGIFQIIHSFMTKTWGSFALNLGMGILYTVGGFLIMNEPVQGSVIITIFLIAALVVGGIMRIMVGLRHRELKGWWLLVLGGIVSVVVAVMLYAMLPWSGLWVLGTLIAIELLIQGFTWLQFGLSLRRLGHGAGTTV
ncbi:MAG: HdeD family acid-resistance protein [Rhodopila sp.]